MHRYSCVESLGIVAKFHTQIDVPLGVGAARSQTLIYTANQSQWRSVEGDRAFKLVEVSRLRSSSNTLPQLGYAAVNCSADASAATAIDQSSLRSRIYGVPETINLSFRPGIFRSISSWTFVPNKSLTTFYATNKVERYLYICINIYDCSVLRIYQFTFFCNLKIHYADL